MKFIAILTLLTLAAPAGQVEATPACPARR